MTSPETKLFERVVILNEGAKDVLRRAFQVSLHALDATVRSRRAGGSLRGFDEVSSQMRQWSRELGVELERLASLTREAALQTSQAMIANRTERLLRAGLEGLGGRPEFAEDALARVSESREAYADRQRKNWRAIAATLGDLNQLALMACVLARSALMESAYASAELRQDLTHVSREFYQNTDHISDILRSLNRISEEAA